jgi:N-acetylglucosaminyl-diphospho-decaprenol L-rhamnosyltransferase
MTPTVGAVIVTWNSEADLRASLTAALSAGLDQIVVVDNGSRDRSRDIAASFSTVQLISCPGNAGFAGGVNRGVAALTTDYVLILNPDCYIESGIPALVAAAAQGAAAGRLCGFDGAWQSGFAARRLPTPLTLIFEVLGFNRLFPSNPINRHYRCANFHPDQDQEVEQPPGAFFLVQKAVFNALGGMDEGFWPVWFEDVDFCARLRSAGYRIRYTPKARALHRGGASVSRIYWPFKELAWYGSLLRYATLHFGWLARRLVGLAVAAASVPRSITGIIFRRQGLRAFGVYARVFSLAWICLLTGQVDIRRFGRQWEGADQLENA